MYLCLHYYVIYVFMSSLLCDLCSLCLHYYVIYVFMSPLLCDLCSLCLHYYVTIHVCITRSLYVREGYVCMCVYVLCAMYACVCMWYVRYTYTRNVIYVCMHATCECSYDIYIYIYIYMHTYTHTHTCITL